MEQTELHTSQIEVNNWLDSKINNSLIKTKYSMSGAYLLMKSSIIKNMEDYDEYYKKNDYDLRANDKTVLKFLDYYYNCLKFKNKNWEEEKKMLEQILQQQDINKEELDHIYNIIEIYNSTTNVPYKILIPPNTYRAHAHYLFKNIKDNNYRYQYKNRKGKVITFNLLGKNFKNKFYKFCYKNTIN